MGILERIKSIRKALAKWKEWHDEKEAWGKKMYESEERQLKAEKEEINNG